MHPQECILGSLGVLGLFEHLAQVTQPGWLVPDLHTSSSKPLGLPLRPEEALSSALIVDVEVFFLARPTAWWRLCKSDPNPWQPTSIALHLVTHPCLLHSSHGALQVSALELLPRWIHHLDQQTDSIVVCSHDVVPGDPLLLCRFPFLSRREDVAFLRLVTLRIWARVKWPRLAPLASGHIPHQFSLSQLITAADTFGLPWISVQ